MSRESIVKCKCDRCGKTVEVKSGFMGYAPYPNDWRKIESKRLCNSCAKDWDVVFRKFMKGSNGKN